MLGVQSSRIISRPILTDCPRGCIFILNSGRLESPALPRTRLTTYFRHTATLIRSFALQLIRSFTIYCLSKRRNSLHRQSTYLAHARIRSRTNICPPSLTCSDSGCFMRDLSYRIRYASLSPKLTSKHSSTLVNTHPSRPVRLRWSGSW